MQPQYRSAEVIVIGAGIGGLATAKTYFELSPLVDLVIVEKVSRRPASLSALVNRDITQRN